MVLYPEGYLSNEEELEEACAVAKENNIIIITSYRKDNKYRAVMISNLGDKILDRAKTMPDDNVELCTPLDVEYNGIRIEYILCMEILKGERDLVNLKGNPYFIAHPIGVGMFSHEQFELWVNEAKKIAKKYNTIVLGTSNADGSYRNCGISIPISYCIDKHGEPVYISKLDTRSRIVDTKTMDIRILRGRE